MTGFAQEVSVLAGVRRSPAPQVAGRILAALFAAVVAGGFGLFLVLFGMTWLWLGALCGVVFVLWLAVGLRRAVVSVGLLEVRLAHDPPHLVLSGPWATYRYALHDVAAIQVWCDCGSRKPTVDPHRDCMEVLLRNGSTVRIQPGASFSPDVGVMLREVLEPGVKVVDWGWSDARS